MDHLAVEGCGMIIRPDRRLWPNAVIRTELMDCGQTDRSSSRYSLPSVGGSAASRPGWQHKLSRHLLQPQIGRPLEAGTALPQLLHSRDRQLFASCSIRFQERFRTRGVYSRPLARREFPATVGNLRKSLRVHLATQRSATGILGPSFGVRKM